MQQEDQKTRVTVNIFDTEYVVKANETPQYIQRLSNMVDRKMRQIAQSNQRLSVTKIAVLTALNLADELAKLQDDYDALVKLIEEAKKS